MLSEDLIIKALALESKGFIGDDAAILPDPDGARYIITKDLLVEDVHFRMRYFKPEDLAHKALHVNLSDLAAMGAMPKYILCGISIPKTCENYAQSFLKNLLRTCSASDFTLIGGDTTRSPDKLYISITAIGVSAVDNIKYRDQAKKSDIICVAGNLGHAHLGLTALERNDFRFEAYKQTFLKPYAKIKEGMWLSQQRSVNSLMDISDGLLIDLKRLCDACNMAGIIELEKLEFDQQFLNACKDFGFDPVEVLLTGGEDYGLLFTTRPKFFKQLADDFSNTFGYALKSIGHITSGTSVSFSNNNSFIDLRMQPFTHFGEHL